jgi:hypothetical protein
MPAAWRVSLFSGDVSRVVREKSAVFARGVPATESMTEPSR